MEGRKAPRVGPSTALFRPDCGCGEYSPTPHFPPGARPHQSTRAFHVYNHGMNFTLLIGQEQLGAARSRCRALYTAGDGGANRNTDSQPPFSEQSGASLGFRITCVYCKKEREPELPPAEKRPSAGNTDAQVYMYPGYLLFRFLKNQNLGSERKHGS